MSYIYFSDILIYLNLNIVRIILLGFIVSFGIVTIGNLININNFRHRFLLVVPIILIPFYLIVWDNILEINVILNALIGYIFYKDKEFFLSTLKILIVLQFSLILYEWLGSEPIYTKIFRGYTEEIVRDYGTAMKHFDNTGFRAKGLFSGTLIASGFAIGTAVIFSKNIKIVIIIFLMAVMTNGRLAILIVGLILTANLILHIKKLKIASLSKSFIPITIGIAISSILIIIVINNFLSQTAKLNLFSVFDIGSVSNFARLEFMRKGLQMFIHEYNLMYFVFGRSDYFNQVIGHSAESDFVNIALNLGLTGLIFFIIAFIMVYKKAKGRDDKWLLFLLLLNVVAVAEYRHASGFERGSLLWFFIMTALSNNEYSIKNKAKLKFYEKGNH